MRPTSIFVTVFAVVATQGQITAAVPLRSDSNGWTSGTKIDGQEPGALVQRDAAPEDQVLQARAELDPVQITNLALSCVSFGLTLTLAVWQHNSRLRKQVCDCGAEVINKGYGMAGKHQHVDSIDLEKGITKSLQEGVKLTGAVHGVTGSVKV
ncbi:hypothetical protein ANO11243_027400 [Dothideomycetidae sp. 11243]|nr:hypothetical protein ANO11243_027400 [fungal sp. No.11243]